MGSQTDAPSPFQNPGSATGIDLLNSRHLHKHYFDKGAKGYCSVTAKQGIRAPLGLQRACKP